MGATRTENKSVPLLRMRKASDTGHFTETGEKKTELGLHSILPTNCNNSVAKVKQEVTEIFIQCKALAKARISSTSFPDIREITKVRRDPVTDALVGAGVRLPVWGVTERLSCLHLWLSALQRVTSQPAHGRKTSKALPSPPRASL